MMNKNLFIIIKNKKNLNLCYDYRYKESGSVQFTHALHLKYRYANDTFLKQNDISNFDWILVILYM